MSEKVTIELPDELSRRARKLAAAANRRLEDAVIDWINRAVSEPDVEALPADAVLRRCDATFEASEQDELSGLLADAREGTLDTEQQRAIRRTNGGRCLPPLLSVCIRVFICGRDSFGFCSQHRPDDNLVSISAYNFVRGSAADWLHCQNRRSSPIGKREPVSFPTL